MIGGRIPTVVAPLVFAVIASTVMADSVVLKNVQMNADYDPPRPQNEPAVAFNLSDPMNAVAMSNDRPPGGRGLWIGATNDGGRHWSSLF